MRMRPSSRLSNSTIPLNRRTSQSIPRISQRPPRCGSCVSGAIGARIAMNAGFSYRLHPISSEQSHSAFLFELGDALAGKLSVVIRLSVGLAPLLRKPSTVIAECVLDLGVEDRYGAEVGHFWHEQVPCAKGRGSARARVRRCKDGLTRCPSMLKKFSSLSIRPWAARLACGSPMMARKIRRAQMRGSPVVKDWAVKNWARVHLFRTGTAVLTLAGYVSSLAPTCSHGGCSRR